MIASIGILFRTKKALNYLDEQYEDKLNVRINLIFAVFGSLAMNIKPELRPGESLEFFNGLSFIALTTISILFGMVFGTLVYRYLVTYLLYGLGKLLKGKAELIDLRVVIAFSLIPLILRELITLIFGILNKNMIEPSKSFEYCYLSIHVLFWLLMLKILLQGLVKFNEYGIGKGILNLTPIILYGLGWYGLYFIF